MDGNEDTPRLMGFDDYVVSLGDELRGERATRGKSLLDVQRDLHIKASYIAAIENCDSSVFPNKGFIAGYVRSYARYLGLNQEEIYLRFCHHSGFSGVNSELSQSRPKNSVQSTHQVLKGAELAPRFSGRVTPKRSGLLEAVSPSGIASVGVLLLIVLGLGFGGWSVLQDIQRVEFAPVESAPGLTARVDSLTVPLDAQSPGVLTPTESPPQEVATALDRLYRPQELTLPRMEPRDGPIAAIDPDTVGVLKPRIEVKPTETTFAELPEFEEEFQGPIVTIEATPPSVELLATRAAWVRVYESDGSVLFEKILEKGERYAVPLEADAPLLRAGNSGSVYLVVDGTLYGPVGNGTSVAKEISLAASEVPEVYAVAADVEIPTDPSVDTADNQ